MDTDQSTLTDRLTEKMGSSGKERKSRAARITKDKSNLNSILKKKYIPVLQERESS